MFQSSSSSTSSSSSGSSVNPKLGAGGGGGGDDRDQDKEEENREEERNEFWDDDSSSSSSQLEVEVSGEGDDEAIEDPVVSGINALLIYASIGIGAAVGMVIVGTWYYVASKKELSAGDYQSIQDPHVRQTFT